MVILKIEATALYVATSSATVSMLYLSVVCIPKSEIIVNRAPTPL